MHIKKFSQNFIKIAIVSIFMTAPGYTDLPSHGAKLPLLKKTPLSRLLSKNTAPKEISTSWDNLLSQIKHLISKRNKNGRSLKAFISYAWEDTRTPEGLANNSKLQRYLETLRNDLQAAGISVFLDITNMHGDIQAAMQKHLNESDIVFPILTPRFKERALDPKTNLAFEYKLILEKLKNNPNALFPLHYAGDFSEAVPKDLWNCLVRDFRNPETYKSSLVELQRPIGVLPAIYNIDYKNDSYKKLIDNWKVEDITALPPSNPDFTGRKALLKKLKNALGESKGPLDQKQVISGMAGAGKSELVLAFAAEYLNEYNTIRLFNTANANLKSEFSQIATQLGIDIHGMEINEIVSSVYKKLESFSWLLIFDNADNDESVKTYLPQRFNRQQHIIITSRNQNWPNSIKVEPFNDNEAYEYVKRLSPKITKQETKELAQAVGHLPLALNHAIMYINKVGISVRSYLKLYERKGIKILHAYDSESLEGKQVSSALNTITMIIEKIKTLSPAANDVLLKCAYLNSDNIPIKLFTRGGLAKNEKELHKALLILRNYSLVESSQLQDHIKVHKLVQSAIRHENRKNPELLISLLTALTDALENNYSRKKSKTYDPIKAQLLLSHINSLLKILKTSEKTIKDHPQKIIIETKLHSMAEEISSVSIIKN